MSDLRPEYTKITLGGKEYRMLLTLKAIDEIQDRFDVPISELFKLLNTGDNVLGFIVSSLSDEESPPRIEDYEIMMVLNKVAEAFLSGTPLNDNPNPPLNEGAEKLNIARFLFIGKVLLGFPEEEVWRMTLKKLVLLHTEYLKEFGVYKAPETIEDLIPW